MPRPFSVLQTNIKIPFLTHWCFAKKNDHYAILRSNQKYMNEFSNME